MSEPHHLQRLNPEQYQAVVTTDGPLLVLAGAGSGKTRVLTRRIAQLLHVGVSSENVLSVTFTNKAAAEMRERVAELVGDAAAKLWVGTFHSTCCRILRADIEPLGFTRRFAIYDDDDQMRLIKGIVANAGYDTDRVNPRDISARIDGYKNRMLGPDDVLAERRSHLGDPLIRVWREYEESLRAADALDFNDLIGRCVELFQKVPEARAKWSERFRYVLVDEYQDTNRGQYMLLRLLCDEHRNLAVVGDDDQSIYGFRGADIQNILNFQIDYPEAKVVRLEQNYRSSANIVALANAVVSHNPDRLEKRLWTDSASGPKIQLILAADPRSEALRVADAIQKLRRMGMNYGDIAVVYRTNAAARHFEAALRAQRIPHRIVGGRRFYERREVRDILAYLRLMLHPGDDAAFLRIVNVPPRGIGAKTQSELRNDAASRGMPLLATARARGAGRTAQQKGLSTFAALVDELVGSARDLPLPELVSAVIERSGYRAMLEGDRDKSGEITQEARERLKSLDALVEDARAHRAAPALDALDPIPVDPLTSWLDRITLASDTDEVPEGGEVTLLTVHSSKGLEFPVVFVVQMNEGMFPHERSLETGLEEERRLAYVAFTRAMQRLVVTRSLRDITNEPTTPSRFLYGVPAEVLDGDLPDGSPTVAEREQRQRDARDVSSKMAVFLEHRTQAQAAMPEGEYTLIDIEDAEQLATGVKILHPRFGVGEIRHIVSSKLRVAFGDTLRTITPTRELRIVVD